MERTPKLIAGVSTAVVLLGALGAYAYFQSREYIRGPLLTIDEPINGAVSATSLMPMRGKALNISFLTLNGRQIFTDEQGRFEESLLLSEGYSIMTLEAKDRFGHTETRRLELVYKPLKNQNGNSKMENASTSTAQF